MNDIISESNDIFNTLDKWTAVYEINQQIPAIIDRWLTIGAEALREDFESNPSQGWQCYHWGSKRDSRWYLADMGLHSVSFGFGWPEFEFHLFLENGNSFDWQKAIDVLAEPEFEPLLLLFGGYHSNTPYRSKDGSLCSDRSFNPFSDTSDQILRQRIIAWHAAHDKDHFIKTMSKQVRQITDDTTITGLICQLNHRSKRDA